MSESAAPAVEPSSRITAIEILVGLVAIALFAWAYIYVLKAFYAEADKRFVTVVSEEGLGADYVDAKFTVTGVDPVKGELVGRIEFEPQGSLLGEDRYTLARDVNVSLNSVKGKQLETYKKGTRLPPVDVVLALFDGEATQYPFDVHQVELDLQIDGEEGENDVSYPIALEFEGSTPGFGYDVENTPNQGLKGFSEASIEISRSPTVKAFSIFIMTLIWAISFTILTMTLAVWRRGRKLEFGMLTFIAAMLFAFPAIRNLQPMVPPIGALPDFIAVFWAQAITGLCLCIMLGVWLARPVKG